MDNVTKTTVEPGVAVATNAVRRCRKRLSRFVALASVVAIFATEPLGGASAALQILGLLLVQTAILGRIWSALFLCGYKTVRLVTVGPYSVTRNPLYLFNLCGVAGIGVASQNALAASLLLTSFAGFYPLLVREEEAKLRTLHGETFDEYARRTPRFFPRFSQYVSPPTITVDVHRVTRNFLDVVWFLAAYLFAIGVGSLHRAGTIAGWL